MGGPAEKKRFGPYEIVGRLGFGGMGIVLDARGDDGKPVALKLLRPTGDAHKHKVFAARFQREAKILKRLTHPGVVRLLDSGTIHGIFFLAMERVEGKSLGALLKRATMDAETIVALGIKLGETLAHLHEIGVVHRDIKPDNVIIDTNGHPILTDFGLARLSGGTAITRANELVGSLGYIAPEVIEGSAPSPFSDQYALGRLMFNLAAKKREDSNDGVPLLEALQRSMKLDWSTFPKEGGFVRLAEVINRMVAREPAQRFPDMYSLIVELDTLSRAFVEAEYGTDKFAALRAKTEPRARALTQSAPPESEVRPVSRNWEDDTRWDPDAEKKLLAIAAQLAQPQSGSLADDLSSPAALRGDLEWVRPATDRDFVGLSGAIALGPTDVVEEGADPSGNVGDTIDMMIKLRKRRALPYSVIEAPAADNSDRAARLRKVTQQFWSQKLQVADTNPPPEPLPEPPADVLEHWRHIVDDLGSFTADVKTVKMTPMAIAEAGGEDFRVPPPAERARGAISFMRSVEPELVIEAPVEALLTEVELDEGDLAAHEASTIPPALAIIFEEPTIPPPPVPPPGLGPREPSGYSSHRRQLAGPPPRRPKAPPMQAPPIPLLPPDAPTQPRQVPAMASQSRAQHGPPSQTPHVAPQPAPSRSQPPPVTQTPARSQPSQIVHVPRAPSTSSSPIQTAPARSQPQHFAQGAPINTSTSSSQLQPAPSRSQPPQITQPPRSPSTSQLHPAPSRSQPTQPPQSRSQPPQHFAQGAPMSTSVSASQMQPAPSRSQPTQPPQSRSQPPQHFAQGAPMSTSVSASQMQPAPSRSQPTQPPQSRSQPPQHFAQGAPMTSSVSASQMQPAPSRSQPTQPPQSRSQPPQHFAQGAPMTSSVSSPQLAPSRSQPTHPVPVAPSQAQPAQSRPQPTQPPQSRPQPTQPPQSRSQPTQPAQPAPAQIAQPAPAQIAPVSTPPPRQLQPTIEAAIEAVLEAETFSPLIAYPDTETTAPPSKPLPVAPSVLMAEQATLPPVGDRIQPQGALATPVLIPSVDVPRTPRRHGVWIAALIGGAIAAAALALFLWSKTR